MKPWFKSLSFVAALTLLGACGTANHASQNGAGQAKKQTPTNSTAKKTGSTTSDTSNTKTPTDSGTNDPSSPGGSSKITTVTNPTSTLVLVNKTHKLPDGYVPPNLMYPNVKFPYTDLVEKREMRAVAAHALEKMFAAASKDGITLYAESGYRAYTTQKAIFANNVKTEGYAKASVVSAVPGTSEHQTGLAMDLTAPEIQDQLIQAYGDTPEGKWVAAHAHEYGFIIRYPKGKENITGYEYEPWHIRYVGVKAATYIYKHNLTLEQYLAQKGTQG